MTDQTLGTVRKRIDWESHNDTDDTTLVRIRDERRYVVIPRATYHSPCDPPLHERITP